ncbi:metalloproteinase inhibitor 2-like [Syngnathus scovelli]|uniref:metalloproteinase inhibitor 2-like n=1 Tax=Syngnathus scovelli TaxID=161590 RepID=UPI0021101F00|nr:metalloproteinase inhibitor 2-like [Syngnathus scovelli]
MSWKNFVLPLVLLTLWGLQEEGVQACSCFPTHPQQLYCQADVVVIKAKIVGVMPGEQGKNRLTKYDIKQIKTFKGPMQFFDAIYTGANSALCGVSLTEGTEYLLMGRLHLDGSLHLSLCDFYQPLEALSNIQKHLLYHYGKGCVCMIRSCFTYPCCMSGPTECLWTDFLPGKVGNRVQAQNYTCVKMSDGCCAWHQPAIYAQNGHPAVKG